MKRSVWVLLLALFGLLIVTAYSAANVEQAITSASQWEADYQVFLPCVMKGPAASPTPAPTATPTATPTPQPVTWLTRVNELRSWANLPPVTENSDWSNGCVLHSRYVVKNDELTHYEDPNNPWYTQEGYDAGRNGNVMCSSDINTTDVYAINLWMVGPFHGLGIIDPRLERSAFGSYREAIGMWKMAATLDVLRGLNWSAQVNYPVFWPANGKTVDLSRFTGGEYPNPLSSCPGYTAPTGLPVIIQLGTGSVTPNITAHSFKQGNTALDHCIFDETTYTNSDSGAQQLGRSVLNMRDAVVIIPKAPLQPGQTYTVSITNGTTAYTWSFTIASTVQFMPLNVETRY